jgi:hypothetical protein
VRGERSRKGRVGFCPTERDNTEYFPELECVRFLPFLCLLLISG